MWAAAGLPEPLSTQGGAVLHPPELLALHSGWHEEACTFTFASNESFQFAVDWSVFRLFGPRPPSKHLHRRFGLEAAGTLGPKEEHHGGPAAGMETAQVDSHINPEIEEATQSPRHHVLELKCVEQGQGNAPFQDDGALMQQLWHLWGEALERAISADAILLHGQLLDMIHSLEHKHGPQREVSLQSICRGSEALLDSE